MTIMLDNENGLTILSCDGCGMVKTKSPADGVVPDDWISGQIWIDLDLSRQRQVPICFCKECGAGITMATFFNITFKG